MDTQILSYLKRFVFNSKENIPGNFYEVLNYLITNDVNVDPFEYLYENVNNIDSHLNDITMTLYAFEIFKNLNKDYWKSNGLLVSNLKHTDIIDNVNSEIKDLKTVFKNIKEYMSAIFNLIYICLLKMIIIELSDSHKSWYFKLDKFLEYLNGTIGVMAHREIIIAKEYFIKGHNLRFFKKINKNMKKPFDIIKNMAWDLYHLHNIERNNLIFTNDDVYFIPCLLTYDIGLVQIAKLCSIKMMAVNFKTRQIIIQYDEMEMIRNDVRFEKYFTDIAFFNRSPINNMDEEIKNLENDLLDILEIKEVS